VTNKNDDIVELIFSGKDEYSQVSEGVREELALVSKQADDTRKELVDLERSLDLADSFREQEAELAGLVKQQATAQRSVQALTQANRESKGANAEVTESLIKAKAELSSLRTATTRAQKAFDQTRSSMRQYGVEIDNVEANQSQYRQATDRLAKELTDLSKAQTQLINKAKSQASVQREIAEASQLTQKAVLRYRSELSKLVDQYRQGALGAEQFEQAERRLRQSFQLSANDVKQARQEMRAYAEQINVLPTAQTKATTSANKLARGIRGLAGAYAALEAARKAAEAAGLGYAEYTKTENALLGVQKTTSLTATEINGLADEMRRLSADVTPTTQTELLSIAEAAGKMGIEGAANISAFVKSIDALSSTTDLIGDDAATALARIIEVTGETQSNVTGVASSINALGNSVAATESEIVKFAQRLATDTATMKLASSEVLGLAAGMAQMGIQAEGASSVIGRTFRKIESAVKGGGDELEELSRVTGLSGEAITEAFGNDKVALFGSFINGLTRMQGEGKTLNDVLSAMGLKSDENARILGLLSQKWGGMSDIVNLSNDAFTKANGHFIEVAKQAASLESGFDRLTNRARSLAEVMGEAFSDDLSRAMDNALGQSDDVDSAFAELGETLAEVVERSAAVAKTVIGVGQAFREMTGSFDIGGAVINTTLILFNGLLEGINFLTGGLAQLGIAWNQFFGDTEAVEKWTTIQEDAFKRVEDAQKRYKDRIERMEGTASRAFQDLRDSYNENRAALSAMDDEQRKALDTIINSTGYLEGNDKVYRDLTRSIQRAAAEKRIITEYTQEENALLESSVALLKATGLAEAEAVKQAKAAIEAKRAKAIATENQAIAEKAEAAAKEENASASVKLTEANEQAINGLKNLSTQELAYKLAVLEAEKAVNDKSEALNKANQGSAEYQIALIGLISAQNKLVSITQVAESQAVKSFTAITSNANTTSQAIKKAFTDSLNTATSIEQIKALVDQFKQLQQEGRVSASDLKAGLEQVDTALVDIADSARTAAATINGISLSNTGISSYLAELDQAKASQESKTEATQKDTSATTENTEAVTKNAGAAAAASERASTMAGYTYKLAGLARDQWVAMGQSMSDAFDKFVQRTQDYQKQITQSGNRTAGAFMYLMNNAYALAANQAEKLVKRYNAQTKSAERFISKLSDTSTATAELSEKAEKAISRFDLLGEEQLSTLRSAIAAVKAETDSLNESLASTLNSLRDELDGLNDDTLSIETRAYKNQLADLNEQLDKAQELGSKEAINSAREAIALLKETYSIKKENLAAETKQESNTNNTVSNAGSNTGSSTSRTVNITVGGRAQAVSVTDQASEDALISALEALGEVTG